MTRAGAVERIGGLAAFEAIERDWSALYEESKTDNLYLTHEWILIWAHAFKRELTVLLLREGQKLVAALPLDSTDPSFFVTLRGETYRSGMLGTDARAQHFRTFLRFLFFDCKKATKFVLHRLPDTAETRDALKGATRPFSPFVLARWCTVSRWIDVGTSLEEYLARRPSKVRQELRRKDKRFTTAYPNTRFVEIDDCGEAMRIIATVERDSWKAGEGTTIEHSDGQADFYRGVLSLRSSRPRLFALLDGDAPIAFLLGVTHGGSFEALKNSFCQHYAKDSPGIVLFLRLIEVLAREGGTSRIELLGIDARWKKELGTGERGERTFDILRPTPLNALKATVIRARDRKEVLRVLKVAATVRAFLRQ